MQEYRGFVSAKEPDVQIGYGSRLSSRRCEWVPKACERGVKRFVIDLDDAHDEWKNPGSELAQPPWNHWPEVLTDQLLSDVMFSLQSVLVQSIQNFTNIFWEIEVSSLSKKCALESHAVYCVPTAWMADAPVREHFLRYGVDMFFDHQRRLVAIYDATAAQGEPQCWNPHHAQQSEAHEKKWLELKKLGMAAVLALQPYVYHAMEKVAVGGVMWSGILGLPVGHPIRNIMMPFGHRSLEKVNQIYHTTLDSGDFFRWQTALTTDGWKMVTNKALELALKFSYPTGTAEFWQSRGLKESGMPMTTFGAEVREVQKRFVARSLHIMNVSENPLEDANTNAFASTLREQWNLDSSDIRLNTIDDLADLLSELLYRMSVTHTNTHHHPICHSAMPNVNLFPMQLIRGSNGDVFPTADHFTATMVIWDMGTEPMPHMDYPLAENGVFAVSSKSETEKMGEAYAEYQASLLDIERRVHDYNRKRCEGGDIKKGTGCVPYSCVIPRELLMSFGI